MTSDEVCEAMFCEEKRQGFKPFCKSHWRRLENLDRLDILQARNKGQEAEDRSMLRAFRWLANRDGFGEYLA